MTYPSAAQYSSVYRQVDVETASQGKLIVMLFDGAIQRAQEGMYQLEKGHLEGVHNNLVRAQEILAELRASLNMKAGDIARNLDRIYEYLQHLLIKGNLRKEAEPIEECVAYLKDLRDTWAELFDRIAREQKPAAPHLNQHGSAFINMRG